jgi:imidazolonepropionase-like amidohydrolase
MTRMQPGTRSLPLAVAALLLWSGPVGAENFHWPPLPEAAPRAVVVQGATVWTSGPQGILEDADLLVRDGRVVAVGRDLDVPSGALVIDAQGKHVTPGLIDCHSHSDIVGGVNDYINSCSAEVRIEDVVNSKSIALYRELAGGLTISNLLHGSANAIGGQNAVVKLRWGAEPGALLLDGAPPGIKFALGENPKRSNWGENYVPRYPATRMGVEQVIRERFDAALDYQRAWKEYQEHPKEHLPPRRDLQLDALVEILAGERLVHCHSYRQDEILMLLRVAEDYGFTVGTFQHVLEGYKVADEIAAGEAGASAFSDWWAYKFEVYDAIPYNGSLMHDRDVLVSFNSDSSELARRMNLEAAKAVKYGGTSETEALKFVTLNPAMQLGIDDRVGSLEAGKDGDFVIWSGHPLSTYTVCEQTWIDGRRYFDRQRDLELRDDMLAERERLLAKAREAAEKGGASGGSWSPSYLEDNGNETSCRHDHDEVQP